LPRKLGFFPLFSIVVANMVGAGIFTTSGLLMENLGDVWVMLLLWLAGGAVALCGALSYSELAAAMPQAGGEYVFLSRLFHPLAGFLSGWVSFIAGFSAPIAASAIGFSEYFLRAFPELFSGFLSTGSAKKLLALAIILLFTAVHLRGISFGARVQNFLTVLKIILIVGLIGAGLWFGAGNWSHFAASGEFATGLPGWKAGGLALMWIMFAYSGWNAATYIGSEVKSPRRNIPRALIAGTLTVMLLYLSVNIFYVYAVSPDEMKGVVPVAALAVGKAFGGQAEVVLSLLISFALFSSLSAYLILGPRVYYAMSRDGCFFRFTGEVDAKTFAPSKAILLQSLLSAVMVLSGTFSQISTFMGFALGIFPLMAVAGVFILRRKGILTGKMPGYPWVQLFFLLISSTMLVLAFAERPLESSVALLTVAAGFPAYRAFRCRNPK